MLHKNLKRLIRSTLKWRGQIKNLSIYLISTIISATVSIIINPFLAANLSPEDYAIIGYYTSFNLIILPIVGLSFISYYSRSYYLADEKKRMLIKSTLIGSILILGLLLLLIFLIVYYFYSKFMNVKFEYFPYAIISSFPVYFSVFYSFNLNEKKIRGDAISYFRLALSHVLVLAATSILLVVVFKFGAIGRFSSILITSIIFGIYSLKSYIVKIKFDKAIFIEALKFSWPLSLTGLLYYFFNGVDKVMLEQLNDVETFGYYNVAFQIAAYANLFGTSLNKTFEPDIYKSIAQNNTKKIFRIVLLVVIPVILFNLLFIALAKPLINILTYGMYIQATPYARILALKNITTLFAFTISGIIVGYGYPKVEFINRLISAVLAFILFKILINNYGFYGAAWGQVFSTVIMAGLSIGFLFFKGTGIARKIP